MPWLLLVCSYLLGSIPSSYLAGRFARGIDLRQHGSGNLGATNAFRVLGWKVATPVFLFDVAKGFAPPFFFVRWDASEVAGWAMAYGTAAILGHIFSVFVGFRGGKGVATGAGVFLALAPWAALAGLVVWAGLVLVTRIVSVASIAAAAVVPLAVAFTRGTGPVLWLSLVLATFIIWAHRANIRRLLRGEELAFSRSGTAAHSSDRAAGEA